MDLSKRCDLVCVCASLYSYAMLIFKRNHILFAYFLYYRRKAKKNANFNFTFNKHKCLKTGFLHYNFWLEKYSTQFDYSTKKHGLKINNIHSLSDYVIRKI